LLDLRDYLPGDPPKRIAWKASARRGRLMTKEFESEVPVRCTLFVDTGNGVRAGGPGQNALSRLVEIAAGVAQAGARTRDLVGLCLFDERGVKYVRPARGPRHRARLANVLADAGSLLPEGVDVPVDRLLATAMGLTREVYPELMRPEVNAMPWWLPWWSPQPAWTLPQPPLWARSLWARPWVWLRRRWRYVKLALRQSLAARLSRSDRRRYRWRKRLAALLSVRYGLGPGGLAALLEDDHLCSRTLQRFLAEHQVAAPLPLYDARGQYVFTAPAKVDVLANMFLRAVGKGHDNELFVILADLLEVPGQLGKLLAAVQVARARHHEVMIVCPWPPGLPLPKAKPDESVGHNIPTALWALQDSSTMQALVHRAMVFRYHQAYFQLRRAFAHLRVPVLCADQEDSVKLILERLQRLRILERGVR
jgi:uncharacterized protein (DUF58 family)